MPKTIVICSKCNANFPSPIAFEDKKSFESSAMSGNWTNCPSCGEMVPCNKENMIFKEE